MSSGRAAAACRVGASDGCNGGTEGGRVGEENQSAFHKVFISLPFVERRGQTQSGSFLHRGKGQVNKRVRVCGLMHYTAC